MFKQAVKFCQCSWKEQLLLVYTFCLLGIVRLLVVCVPFRYIAYYLGKHMAESPDGDPQDYAFVRQVSRAISIMSRYTPWESKCLVQGIAGKILLRHRRVQNTLYLGVAKGMENKMIAHAWLRSGNDMVTGGNIDKAFTVVAMFTDVADDRGNSHRNRSAMLERR